MSSPDLPGEIALIDPALIGDAGISPRLEYSETAHKQLMRSIRRDGQQMPVLVRPDPGNPGRYQIVYGRRRVLALRDLGRPVAALVREMDDEALIMAQAQENWARRAPSFLEKAHFAHQMREAGFDRKAISAALDADKTTVSRLLKLIETLSPGLARLIGAAPGIGRDRWMALIRLWPEDVTPGLVEDMLTVYDPETSDGRFAAIFNWLTRRRDRDEAPRRKHRVIVRDEDGARIGVVRENRTSKTLAIRHRDANGFLDWLVPRLPRLFRDWQSAMDETANTLTAVNPGPAYSP